MQWIKASERLPELEKEVHAKLEGKNVFGRFYEIVGKKRFSITNRTELDSFFVADNHFHLLEWLDESSPRLQEAAEWVRVEDGLPEEGEDVLGVHVEAGGIQIVWYDHEEKRWETIDLDPLHTLLITHWRPLPKPPTK